MYRGLAIAAATITACTLIIYAVGTNADTTSCPSGTVPITAATRVTATIAGIPTSAQCWNPNDPNTGETAGDAKLWLQQHATKSANVSCLNSQFAEKLEKFMQSVPGDPPVITSGYRSVAAQNNIIATSYGTATKVTTACGSYHVWGLASDFNNNNAQQTAWMRANAKNFGIATIGTWDPNHFQDANGRYGQCGVCNSSGAGSLPDTTSVTTYQSDDVPPQSITSQMQIPPGYCLVSANPIVEAPCNSMSTPALQTAPMSVAPTQPTQTPTVSGQQCAPQFSCVNDTIYLQTSACTNQVYQTCQYGCAGTVCLPNPASSTSPIIGTTYPIVVPSTTPATSLLDQFANPVLIATATPNAEPSLTSGIYNVISPLTGTTTNNQQTLSQNSSDSGIYGQQTFPSSASPQASGGYMLAPNAIVSVLQNLQTALQHLFSYLVSIGK